MTIAAGMKDIVQDIVSSREVRETEVKGLKKEANEMLDSFEASHKKMSAQLRQDLAEAHDLIQGFQASHKELKAELKEFSDVWQRLVNGGKRKK